MHSSMCLFAFCIAGIVLQASASQTNMEKLASDLTKDYLAYIDPGTDTKLKFSLSYMCADYDETTRELTSKVIEYYTWKDPRLVWTPSRYGGISEIRIPAKLVWTPDFILYNSVDQEQNRAEVNTVVDSTGTVFWIPPSVFKTRCSPSSRSISCQITLGSWTYDAVNLPVEEYKNSLYLGMYLNDTCPYTIRNPTSEIVNKNYPSSDQPWATLEASFEIQRRG